MVCQPDEEPQVRETREIQPSPTCGTAAAAGDAVRIKDAATAKAMSGVRLLGARCLAG
jgi:hypothetical protein